jgi:hypothetical protein
MLAHSCRSTHAASCIAAQQRQQQQQHSSATDNEDYGMFRTGGHSITILTKMYGMHDRQSLSFCAAAVAAAAVVIAL